MFFSIIIPTYNRPDRIFNAVKSVLNQSFSDYEIVIVNDGSSIEYTEFEAFIKNESKINYIKQTNTYLAGARNTGLRQAKGLFICFLDDDDEYMSNHLEALHNSIISNNNKKALYHTRTFIKYEDGSLKKIDETKTNYSSNIDKILSDRFPTNAVCIHTDIAKQFLFDETLKYAEDLDYWIRVSQKFDVIKVNEYTQILPHETEHKMSDFKLPNQYYHLLAFEKFKRDYYHYLPADFLTNNLKMLYKSCADLYSKTSDKKKAFHYWLKTIQYNFLFIFSRQCWGIVKNILT
jgi:glycosyltransferase involved in cell wall biosynthesis